ncbi:MAG: GrpB family protein [Bacillaceae bacterium]
MRKVDVLPYLKEWTELFEQEATQLKTILGDLLIDIHHMGSTAVPSLKAKPIIDIMPIVSNINKVDSYNDEMIKIGYEPRGENGIRARRYFQKGGDNRTHHVHIYEINSSKIKRYLAFRDYLCKHPNVAVEYGELKEQLAVNFPYDIDRYIQGKNELVQQIERLALKMDK